MPTKRRTARKAGTGRSGKAGKAAKAGTAGKARRTGKGTGSANRAKRVATTRPAHRTAPTGGNGAARPRITPFLWFDDDLEEAIDFYTSVFPDVQVSNVARYGEAGPGPKGQVMSASFRIGGQEFGAINGGPVFRFNEAVSFMIECKDQKEVDHYWSKLTANGGQESQCGWCKDRFGLSWQVTPRRLTELLSSKDPVVARKAMEAMMPMRKIDIATLEKAVAR